MTPLVLPWPSPLLGPNSRTHFRKRAEVTKAARRTAGLLAMQAGWQSVPLPEGRLHLWVTFYPPTKRMPDDDNMLGRFKAYRDGIADTLGIDDRRFISHPFVSDVPRKGGEVVVKITGGPTHAD